MRMPRLASIITLYPAVDVAALDQRLLDKMRLAITTAGLGRAAAKRADIKLRQPLAKARVNVGSAQEQEDLLELADVLKEEINVKSIDVVSEVGELVDYKLMPNNRILGPRLGKAFPQVRAALEALDPAAAARALQSGATISVDVNGETYSLDGDDVLVQTESRGGLAVASDKGVTVAVDTDLTPALLREGYARDLVRAINTMRKDAGLDISDRIDLAYEAGGEVDAAFTEFADYIQQETLAVGLAPGTMADPTFSSTVDVGGDEVMLALRKRE